jgi:hypothetical protein
MRNELVVIYQPSTYVSLTSQSLGVADIDYSHAIA